MRGADHYSNTPKQMRILEAMGAEIPVYAHVPLLHGPDGKKLSKRHGAASVQELRDAGYLPEAVRNYFALLGWGYDDETTFHSTEELQQRFSLERVSKSPAVFDEKKLRWMNGHYVARCRSRSSPAAWRPSRAAPAWARRWRSRAEVPDAVEFCRGSASSSTGRPTTRRRARSGSAPREAPLAQAREALAAIEGPWTVEDVKAQSGVVEREGVKPGRLSSHSGSR